MDYKKYLQLADRIAESAHKNQKRKDGSPYINHPRKVVKILDEWADQTYNGLVRDKPVETAVIKNGFEYLLPAINDYKYPWEFYITLIKCLGALHDTIEDQPEWTSERIGKEFRDIKADEIFIHWLLDGLFYLNKNNSRDYSDYIYKLTKFPQYAPVKLADLAHNMSDLTDVKKFEKYALARYLLLA